MTRTIFLAGLYLFLFFNVTWFDLFPSWFQFLWWFKGRKWFHCGCKWYETSFYCARTHCGLSYRCWMLLLIVVSWVRLRCESLSRALETDNLFNSSDSSQCVDTFETKTNITPFLLNFSYVYHTRHHYIITSSKNHVHWIHFFFFRISSDDDKVWKRQNTILR